MWDSTFDPYWPLHDHISRGIYFYNQQINGYLNDAKVSVSGKGEMIMFGSYSYLGLNNHPRINNAASIAIAKYGTGTHGVRLLAGTTDLHKQLEESLASFKKTEAAITFSSGFLTNLSVISCISTSEDVIYCDKLNHASIVDGCNLSRATLRRFKHNDFHHLETLLAKDTPKGKRIVIVDAVYSMDGDLVDLPKLVELCKYYSAILMIDEAHSLGVLGERGRGIVQHYKLPPDSVQVYMGSLGKAIPSVGGYIATSRKLCDYLAHSARGFIYSASLPPPAAAASSEAFRVMDEETSHHDKLRRNISVMKKLLSDVDVPCSNVESAIFPIICGADEVAWKVASHCQSSGIYVQAIPYPVVPQGQARLRASVTALHTIEELTQCAEVLGEAYKKYVTA